MSGTQGRHLPGSEVGVAGDAAILAASYLYGSVPFVYLLARARGVDLRSSGSGNVGPTNLRDAAGGPVAAVGWLADASKGLVPVAVARRLGRGERVAQLAGLCGVAGQCWPIFLRFRGGRGISAFVGAAFMVDRRAWALCLVPMIAGSLVRLAPRRATPCGPPAAAASRSRSVPLGCFLGVLTFAAAHAFRARTAAPGVARAVSPVPPLLGGVVLLRRLTAPLPDDVVAGPAVRPAALLYRLLYDRNTSA